MKNIVAGLLLALPLLGDLLDGLLTLHSKHTLS